MLTAALFTIAKTRKRPNCPLTDAWFKKMECYSAIKNNEIMPFGATWMDLEMIKLSKISQRKTNIICFTYMWN